MLQNTLHKHCVKQILRLTFQQQNITVSSVFKTKVPLQFFQACLDLPKENFWK